ncbi:zinc ribbon domain-containing protein [Kiritimatiellaeota bacterium B1221]|nr:zinc ribbon domain-containing protein [Kiritimatiellaeota bacterium B1221]
MPTYDYECQECNHQLEAFHAMSAEPLKDCPACGKPALKRLIGTGAGVIFKGSGFYQTDYRSDSYKKSAAADSSKPTAGSKKENKSNPTAKKA